VTKPDRFSPHERITAMGGHGWYWPVEDVIHSIETSTNTFYTSVNGQVAYVGIRVNPLSGRKYVQTHSDGYWNNNLLALSECPV
jgi:hypothetical protein